MILIVGHLGGMGRRYAAILNYLGIPWTGVDVEDTIDTMVAKAYQSKGVIICSPTTWHFFHLMTLANVGVPVLCEKPLSTSLASLQTILDAYKGKPLSMVLQYLELLDPHRSGPSFYNYYKTGSDGLIWDCVQIIGLANGDVSVENTSPVWRCTINGQKLSISDMDDAYIANIKRWLSGDNLSQEKIYEIHERTYTYYKNRNWNPSEVNIGTLPGQGLRGHLRETNASVGD